MIKNSFENLKKDLEIRKQQGHPDELNELLQKVESLQQSAQSDSIIIDCCTITLSPESVLQLPSGFVEIGADFYFLECCTTPIVTDALTPCGTIANACTVNEVKAVGHINYVSSFTIPTFYNNGQLNCSEVVDQTFSCSGTVPVNNTFCYSALDEENPCPNFCDGNTQAFAFVKDIELCSNQKAIVTIETVFVLPECNNVDESTVES